MLVASTLASRFPHFAGSFKTCRAACLNILDTVPLGPALPMEMTGVFLPFDDGMRGGCTDPFARLLTVQAIHEICGQKGTRAGIVSTALAPQTASIVTEAIQLKRSASEMSCGRRLT